MTSRPAATFGAGLVATLAVALPISLLAGIADAVLDDGLPRAVATILALVMMAGPVVGGLVVGRRSRGRRRWLLAAAVGTIGFGLVALMGTVRLAASDDDEPVSAATVIALALWGGALSMAGAAAGGRATARTRP